MYNKKCLQNRKIKSYWIAFVFLNTNFKLYSTNSLQKLAHGKIDYITGVRWWDNDIDATVDPAITPGSKKISVDADWVDIVVGARWTHHINDNWHFRLRGDIGGLGLSSDFTGTASAGIIYVINDLMDIDLTYKATWVDYEEGTKGTPDHFEYDTVTHGPILGVNFKL